MRVTNSLFASANTLDDVSECVRRELDAWRTMVTVPTQTTELILGEAGHVLPPEFADELPLEYSICTHVAQMNHPLVVDDAFVHPLLTRHPATEKLGVAAYIGVPVMTVSEGQHTMVLCALEIKPHRWSAQDLKVLQAGAARIRALSPKLALKL